MIESESASSPRALGQLTTSQERIRVRYGETDMMGHAYYANYLFWFEQARGRWCRDRGFTYLQLEKEGFKLPVVEVWVKYRGEVKYDDIIEVRVGVEEMRRSSVKFVYEVVRVDTGQIVTEGYTWHVWVNEEMKAVSLPDHLRARLESPTLASAAVETLDPRD